MSKPLQFSLRNSMLLCGAGSAAKAPEVLSALGGSKCLIVTDSILAKLGFVDKLRKYFAEAPSAPEIVGVVDYIEADARSTQLNQAYQYFKEIKGDCLLAVGGGSVLDSAKALLYMDGTGMADVHKIFSENRHVQTFPAAQRFQTPLVAIPTTAGTGAEISTTSVVSNEETGRKSSIMHPYIGANCAILDAEFTATMPPFMTSTTGVDALAHAWEAFFSCTANMVSDAHALPAIKVVCENIEKAVVNGDDLEAREKMLLGSALAISALGTAFAGMPIHAVSMALGAKYHTPHGLGVAVSFVPVMKVMSSWYLPRIKEIAAAIGLVPDADEKKCLEQVVNEIKELFARIGITGKLKGLHCSQADIDDLTFLAAQTNSASYLDISAEQMAEIISYMSEE